MLEDATIASLFVITFEEACGKSDPDLQTLPVVSQKAWSSVDCLAIIYNIKDGLSHIMY